MNEWQWWQSALAGGNPDIHADTPQCGFFKMRDGKDGAWLPVMIRFDDGALRARVGDNSDADPYKIWTFCAGRPISKEDAAHAFKTGHFPGDAPTIGDNSGDLSIIEQLSEYVAATVNWLKGRAITDKLTADQAANRRSEILRLKKLCENDFTAKAAPHDAAIKSLKAEYDITLKEAEAANKALRDAATVFANAEQDRLDAVQAAKYAAEMKAAAAARALVDEQRAKKLRDDPVAALTESEPELPMLPPVPEPVKVALGGQSGRTSGLRTYWEAEITDHAAALQHYLQHPDVIALVQKLAKADVRSAKGVIKIPGVRPYEDRRVA